MVKLSVIVPVYKVERFIRKCVDSLVFQSYPNMEIILVDDESPDNCPQLCDEYAIQDSRIKVVHKKNGGLGLARNSGLEVANKIYNRHKLLKDFLISIGVSEAVAEDDACKIEHDLSDETIEAIKKILVKES